MHVAVLQSSYLPWRGYFDIIASVDLFIIYDDVQYSKGTWRNRNKVKTVDGMKWLTVPVNVSLGDYIDEVTVSYSQKDWVSKHRGLLSQSLGMAPFFDQAIAPWEEVVAKRPERLSNLNSALLGGYCTLLGIDTPFANSSDYALSGSSTERLISLLKAVGATSYLSGPAAKAYIDLSAFCDAGIELFYKTYDYDPYPQAYGAFAPDASIIDLVANVGSSARRYISSKTSDEKVEL